MLGYEIGEYVEECEAVVIGSRDDPEPHPRMHPAQKTDSGLIIEDWNQLPPHTREQLTENCNIVEKA